MPATAGGSSCSWREVGVTGVLGTVPGVEAPAIVTGAAFSIVEIWEASEPRSPVTVCSQSDFPVEMTTFARVYQINNPSHKSRL